MKHPDFWGKEQPDWRTKALLPASWLYHAGHQIRYASCRPKRAGVPVICVGNVTVGGTGKTPVSVYIADYLASQGINVHFLSRGYGGRQTFSPTLVDTDTHTAIDVGDEPLILARHHVTWVSPDRAAGAQMAAADGAELIVMDDGFQNPGLIKDLSILIFDGEFGIGNGALLPAGPLREPLSNAILRAHAAIIIGDDSKNLEATLATTLPVFKANFVPIGNKGKTGLPVVAFAGIGRPDKFFSSLGAAGYHVKAKRSFPDHHNYSNSDLNALRSESRKLGAKLITTEKDFLRLKKSERTDIEAFTVTLSWPGKDSFSAFLDTKLEMY